MADEKRIVWVAFHYRDRTCELEHDVANGVLVIGRKQLQTLFQVEMGAFRNISRRHITIEYNRKSDQVTASDSSLLGTLARTISGTNETPGPEFLYHHETFIVKRHMRLRLQNESEQREPDDVLIELFYEAHDETRPIIDSPADWDRMLAQLRSLRAGHLVGIPGTGKSTLAKKLLAQNNSLWQRQRNRQLGGNTLVAWVDCRLMSENDATLWRQLGRRMLTALHTAADELYLYELRDELRDAVRLYDESVTDRISQQNAVFRVALRAVVRTGGLRPIFVFDHFDDLFAELDRFMLYQLYQFQQWPELGEMLRYLIVTRRPLDRLRDDVHSDGIADFAGLFGRHPIRLRCTNSKNFRRLWREIAPEYGSVSAETLTGIHKLSGGHPGLTRELYEELAVNGKLAVRDHAWLAHLNSIEWASRPPRSCVTLWQSLTEVEQTALRDYLNGAPVPPIVVEELQEIGLLNRNGELFSPLFGYVVGVGGAVRPKTDAGLLIIPEQQRVFVDGNDVTRKLQGRKLDVLLYLHNHANEICSYHDLIRHTLPDDIHFTELSIESERGSLQRTVSRLCRVVDPERRYISNEQGRGYLLRYSG